jgi:hypothetical protein
MAQPAPVGSDVQAGTYPCTNCGYEFGVQSVQSLPPVLSAAAPRSGKPSAVATAPRILTQIEPRTARVLYWAR